MSLLKRNVNGVERPWPFEETVTWVPNRTPNFRCECGSDTFRVCWWEFPHTGGYCRIVCAACGCSEVLIDDFA